VSSSDAPGASSTESVVKPLSPAGENAVDNSGKSASIEKITALATPSVHQRCARHQRTRSRYHAMMCAGRSGRSCGFKKYAAIIGVSVRATSNEQSTATTTVKLNGLKNSPPIPLMNATGTNTAQIVNVVATTARPISIAASIAASLGFLPMRKWRTMFSTSTIASSTKMPTTRDSASSVKIFSV
jgi:hypothetical protein